MKTMKKLLTLTAIIISLFTACEDPSTNNNTESNLPSLTIRNESSFVLTNVTFSGITFATSDDDFAISSQVTKQLTRSQLNTQGNITFVVNAKGGIALRMTDPVTITDQDVTITISDNRNVAENMNPGNSKSLLLIEYVSNLVVKSGVTTVVKNENVPLGEGIIDRTVPYEFTLNNTGDGKFILRGTTPIQITGIGAEAFSVAPLTGIEAAPKGGSLPFTINFTPRAAQTYDAVVTVNYNNQDPFAFSITAIGVPTKPIAKVFYENTEIPQDGTIQAPQAYLTLSEDFTVVIKNDGTELLYLDTANITITGDHATAFTRTTPIGSSISTGGSTSFIIRFSPIIEGENRAVLTIPTNDISRPTITVLLMATGVQGHAVLELKNGNNVIENNSPTPFSLGQVVVGQQSQQYPFTIKNIGNIALNLTGDPIIASSNPAFSVSLSPASTTLNPEASTEFRIRYTPTVESPVTGTITIENNGDDSPFSFTVTGRGYIYKPVTTIIYNDEVITQNGTIDAGEALVTLSKPITVTIENRGDAVLTIDTANITITGTDMAAFSKTTNPSVSVQDGNQTTFTISCSPIKAGENSATLTIPTNDPNRPNAIVTLKITGVQGYAIPEVRQGTTIIENSTVAPQVDFEQVNVGSNTSLIFNIKNIGNIALLLTGTPVIESSNPAFTIPSPPAASIASDAEVPFNIRYMPTTEGEDTAIITFANNSPELEFSFLVKGTGHIPKPQITLMQGTTAISPNGEHDFGIVAIGENKEIIFTIGNTGDANLAADGGNWIGISGANAGLFTVTQQPNASTTVAPNATTTFTIRYTPVAVGTNLNTTVNINTNSRDNSSFSFTVKGDSSLSAPINVTATAESSSSILVSWNPVPGATSYKVYYGTSSSAITSVASNAVDGTSYTHTGLLSGTTYYYCITAQDGAGESARSQTVSRITIPGIPANLRSTSSSSSSIRLEWDMVAGATSYKLYYATSAEGNKNIVTTPSSNYYTHSSLPANTTYYYFVAAVNSSGDGAFTEALPVRTLLAPLSAPSGVTATALSTSSIEVTWGAVTGAISYKVYREIGSSTTKTLLDTVTTTSYTNTGLTSTTYYYYVTALNADNVESAYSAYASMVPKPNVPNNVTAEPVNWSDKVQVRWSSVTSATNYRIYYATSLTGTKTLAGTSTSTSYSHQGTANTTYYYWVTAYNNGGESDYSLQASALSPPAAPANLRQTARTTTTITLAWNAVAGATSYYIGGDAEGIVNTTSDTITGCARNTWYVFTVTARNSAGIYGPAAEISANTSN